MRQHTSAFRNKIKEHGRELDSVITFTSNNQTIVLGNEDLNMITPQFMGSILKSVMRELTIDSNVEIPKDTILNYKLGVKVRNDEVVDYRDNYDYVDFGNYIVKEVNELVDTHSYEIKCYDKMLLAMKDYESLNVTYPISVKNYLTAICTRLGLTLATQSFVNDSVTIKREHFLTDDNKTLGYTYRDVLDEIAGATASTICINEDDEVEVRYITETNETFDEEYLKDIDVKFKEEYGPVNTIVLSRSAETDNIYRPTTLPANPIELKIKDNDLLNDDDRVDYIDGIYNKLNGLRYYSNDIRSTGICYLDVCDRYTIQIGNDTYSCVMFEDSIDVTTGLVENITTDIPESSVTDYKKADKTDRSINQATLIVDKQQASIDLAVSTAIDAKDTAESVEGIAESAQTTANTANATANRVEGNLSLKIDKGDTGEVVSAFNLNSNQVTISSDNFSLTSAGRITAKSGNIAGFDMTGTKFSKDVSGNYVYLSYDMFRALDCYLRDSSSSTSSSQIMDTGSKKLLDTDNDNKVELLDATKILNYVIGQDTPTKTATGKFYINSDNPRKCVQVVNSDNIPAVSLGVNGVDATNIGCTTFSCTDINANSLSSYSILTMYGKLPEIELHKYVQNSTDQILRIRPQGFATNYGTLKRYSSTNYSGTSYEIIDRSIVTSSVTSGSTNVITSGGVYNAINILGDFIELNCSRHSQSFTAWNFATITNMLQTRKIGDTFSISGNTIKANNNCKVFIIAKISFDAKTSDFNFQILHNSTAICEVYQGSNSGWASATTYAMIPMSKNDTLQIRVATGYSGSGEVLGGTGISAMVIKT